MVGSEYLGLELRERWRVLQCNYPAVQMATKEACGNAIARP